MKITFREYCGGREVEADNVSDLEAYLRVRFSTDPRGPASVFACSEYGSEWMIFRDTESGGVIGFSSEPLFSDGARKALGGAG